MKSVFLACVALSASIVLASSKPTTNALAPLTKSIQSAIPTKEEAFAKNKKQPKVQNFGYDYEKFINDWGFSIDFNLDGAAGYKLPLYADSQYIVFSAVLDFLAGGINKMKLGLWLFNLNFYAEVQGY